MEKREKFSLKEIREAGDDLKNLTINFHPYPILSPYVSYFIINYLPLTPNYISFLWGIIGLIGAAVIMHGGYWWMLAGILIYHLGFILDCTDGELARLSKKCTIGGAYLDKFFHFVHRAVLVLAVGIGIYNTTGEILYLYLGIGISTIFLIDNLGKLKVYEIFANKERFDLVKKMQKSYEEECESERENFLGISKKYAIEMLRPANPFTLLFFAIVFNMAQYYLILMAIVTPLFFIKSFFNVYKKISNIPS
jgi:hypothetical protein